MPDIRVTTTSLRICQGDRLVALVNMTPSQWAVLANDAQRMAREGAKGAGPHKGAAFTSGPGLRWVKAKEAVCKTPVSP